jgi:hypothetical protein
MILMKKRTIIFSKKNIVIMAILLGTVSNSFGYDIKSIAKSWLPTPIYTELKKWIFVQPRYEKIQKKYEKEKYKSIIEDPKQSAQAFRTAIQNNRPYA